MFFGLISFVSATTIITDNTILSNDGNFSNNITASNFLGNLNWSWLQNIPNYAYNSSLINYYLISNPFGFFNSTIFPYTHLTNFTDNLGNREYTSNLNFSNGANYWNDTYATFNKTYADTIYAPINYGDNWNKTYADTLYASISEPLWSSNFTAYNSTWSSTYNASYVPYTGATSNLDIGTHNLTVGSTGLFVNANTGRVGIGTTSPATKLYVSGDSIALDNNYGLQIKDASGTRRGVMQLDTTDDLQIGETSIDDMYFTVGGVNDALTIKQTTGNVGIGTTGPSFKTHISAGDMGTEPTWESTVARNILLLETNDNEGNVIIAQKNTATSGQFGFADNDAKAIGGIQYIHSTDTMNIRVNNAAVMTILNNGNVGIGTTSPTLGKLQVNGSQNGISIYAQYNISAEDYLYHSPFTTSTKEEALSDVLKIKGDNGKINHSSLPSDAVSILEKPIYETIITQEEKEKEVCDDVFDNKTNLSNQVCYNETYLENITTQNQIGVEEEPQTSVGILISKIVLSVQKLFDWNSEQDLRLQKMEATLCLDGHLEYCKL